jgi:hypothetical protein
MQSGSAAKIGGFVVLLLVGWAFVLGSNKFHVTAASVIVCLSYLAILFTVWNLWRTGASAAAPAKEDEGWARPIGARGELEKEKRTLLKGIKEAEFDAAMGKLSKADADSLMREYRGRAIAVIKQIEGLGGAGLSTREQIAHEVQARIALDLSDKPSARAKKVVNARAAKADALAAAKSKPVATAPVVVPELSAEAQAKAAQAAQKVAIAEARAAAAHAAAEAAEAKAEAARAMAEAAEAKAEHAASEVGAQAAEAATEEGERA